MPWISKCRGFLTLFTCCHQVNVDNNNVGFFQSGNLSTSGNDAGALRVSDRNVSIFMATMMMFL